MIQDRPAVDDLLRTVRAFIDSIVPQLAGEGAFHARVASYLLQICERDLAASTLDCAPEQLRWFCAGIRAGDFDARWDEAFDLTLEQVVAKARVVRPAWLDVSQPTGAAPS